MFEKVNPSHPDKVADRIAGAIVDFAYSKEENPKIAVEVLIGHGKCFIIIETDLSITYVEEQKIKDIVYRITGTYAVDIQIKIVPQDLDLARNQAKEIRCGDNGIFKGARVTAEQKSLTRLASLIYKQYPTDGKYFVDDDRMVICQSNAIDTEIMKVIEQSLEFKPGIDIKINPLGPWSGGTDVDSGATNRKLGSDMGDSVTGGGIHGKDLSKADVTLNIYAWLAVNDPLFLNRYLVSPKGKLGEIVYFDNKPCEVSCAIGEDTIFGHPYSKLVDVVRKYIDKIGGFEKFAEWGLIRPV